nr:MAG TPA: hypothetical protein [Caudoviricetes sp.]
MVGDRHRPFFKNHDGCGIQRISHGSLSTFYQLKLKQQPAVLHSAAPSVPIVSAEILSAKQAYLPLQTVEKG